MATVTTPVAGFTGTVVGVTFADGVGQTDDAAALAYFARHGYTIGADDQPAPEPKGNGSREEWAAYADSLGVQYAEDAKRDDIKAAVEAATTSD